MNLTPTQLSLVRLLGKKELTFGCIVKPKNHESFRFKGPDDYATVYKYDEIEGKVWMVWNDGDLGKEELSEFHEDFEILGHVPTLSDLHRWMKEKGISFYQDSQGFGSYENSWKLPYDYSKDLIDPEDEKNSQDESVLKQIESLILSNR